MSKARSSRLGRLVLMSLAGLLTVVLGLFALVIAFAGIPYPVSLLTGVLDRQGLYLIPLGLVALGVAAWTFRGGARRTAIVAGAVAVVATVAACFPLVASWRAADRYGASLSVASYVRGGDNTGTPVEALSVEYTPGLKLDVKLPARPTSGTRPAVVWVHGGGWNLGDRGEAPLWHRWLNDRGYAVFAIDYRLAPPARWDQAPGDVRCAVGWVKANAGRYQVDPARVMLAGGSAGGNLALMGAYADDRVKPSCDVGDTSVLAVAAFYPPSDVAALWRDSGLPSVRGWAENYAGGTPQQQPEHYRLASPVTYVRAGLPPTLLMHGERDHVVPYQQSPELAAKLAAAGVPHELVSVPYAEHIFDFAWGSWGTQICRHTLEVFLARYFPA
ncbi:hypothetical protein Lfu02_04630 [Longispora fulva]|nr:hypothetical protein Lfu02_04630 [Longispora fulva]